MKLHNWEDVPLERLNPLLARQALHCDNMTVSLIHLDKGCVVPEHRHANEQMSILLTGRLRFRGPDFDVTLEPGRLMHLSPDEPHSVEALEDSIAMDLFAPAREDWRTGDDAYLRHPKP